MEEITVKGAEAVFEGKAYREPKALAEELSRRGAAYVLASDAAENDGEHEESIGFMRRLFRELPVPAAAGGYIRRLEDVKKYLYAGASAVWFKEGQEAVMEEASERFGRERILTERPAEPEKMEPALSWDQLKKNESGLVPVIVQDYKTGEVLMMAYMNEQAYGDTLRTGRMNYYSRSRKSQWLKGETSGYFQYVKSLTADCDRDTILAKVSQTGPACHTGARSCFFDLIAKSRGHEEKNPMTVLEDVYRVILDRKENPKEGSYTNYLFDKGIDKILKKVGEEAAEIIIAAKNPDPEEIIYEISDFLYHVMVLMAEKGVSWENITEELAKR